MPSPTTALCQHLHPNGNRCGSPALRGEQFCYYHHPVRLPARRSLATSPAVPFELPPIGEPEDIQIALFEIMKHLANSTLDVKRASVLLECVDRASSFVQFRPGP